MFSHSSKRGFTLIELIVTISIGMIILGGALAGFLQFQERRKVEAAAREVHQLYVTAKANAVARKVPNDNYTSATTGNICRNSHSNNRLSGYRVTRSNFVFTLVAVCTNFTQTIRSTTVPDSLTVSAPSSVTFFSLPDSNGKLTDATPSDVVSIGASGKTYTFTISQSGAISNVE